MKIYNKLVRDKIPEIIANSGRKFAIHTADESEYKKALLAKLQEEVTEFLESPCIEEIADIYEVIESIIQHFDFSVEELANTKAEKLSESGSFQERIILEHVE